MRKMQKGLLCASGLMVMTSFATPFGALAEDNSPTAKQPAGTNPAVPLSSTPINSQQYDSDTLLITVNSGSDKQEVADTLRELHATVTETIDTSIGQVLVLKTERGKLADVRASLTKDNKHFANVQLNHRGRPRYTGGARALNDPFLPSQWQLGSIRATAVFNAFPVVNPRATDSLLVIMDGGASPGRSGDAGSKMLAGYDATRTGNNPGNVDQWDYPHGSTVFNASGAQGNNGRFGAGLHNGQSYPIRVFSPSAPFLSDVTLIKAFNKVEELTRAGRRCVVNMSFGYDAPFDLNNEAEHPQVTAQMKRLYAGGKVIIFQAAENISRRDPNPRREYLNVVAGAKQNETRADFSGYGPSVQFVGPAQSVFLYADGRTFATSGNSYSSPLVASVAARIWNERPGWSGPQIKSVLVTSSRKLARLKPEEQGNGMPDARVAMRRVTGR
jgi:hypothetical protein